MNWADFYSQTSESTGSPQNVDQAAGPNQGSVTGSGQTRAVGGVGPAFSWLIFVALLVATRIFAELGGRG